MPLLGRLSSLLPVAFFALLSTSFAQTNILTGHNDVGRTGLNPTETILTPANVNANTFGKLYSIPIDGQSYAQPLYISSLAINGVNHSVLFVATEHDTLTAYDTNAQGAVLWQADMKSTAHGAAAGATSDPLSTTGCTDVQGPEYGIKSTPVIDLGTSTIYATARTLEAGQVVWRFHALDLTTGNEKFGGPIVVSASIPGTAPDAVNGQVVFNPKWQNQRPGLLLINGVVYTAWGSVCDIGAWHGWIMGYSAASGTLQQTTAFVTTPNGSNSGIWMVGAGLAADTENGLSRIFATTGNGDYNATTPYGTNTMNYGDDILSFKQGSSGGLTVSDVFTPDNQLYLEQNDVDLGSGGVVVLPDNLPGSPYPHLAVQIGKSGAMFLLNRDNLGGYSPSVNSAVQEIAEQGIWGTPGYWNGNIYFWPNQSHMKQYSLTNGALSKTPVAQGSITQVTNTGHPFLGTTVSVSSNGTTNPIVWASNYVSWAAYPAEYFYAYDGTNVANLLWSSEQVPNRDGAGPAQKYAVPTIADGRVYLASRGNIQVYGLLPPDFWLTIGQSLVSVPPTSSVNIPLTVNNQGNFTGAVSFSLSGLPAGVTGNISNGILTLSVASTATLGSATIVVTGTCGTLTHSISLLLNVTAPSNAANAAVETPLNLAPYYNVLGIEGDGTSAYYGGLDGNGYEFSASFLGGPLVLGGIPYNFGPANFLNSVTSSTISVPALAGSVGPLQILATAANGNQVNQTFTLTYTDGSTSTYTQSMSDWGSPQKYPGESTGLSMAYRVASGGGQSAGPFTLYAYTIPLTSGKVLSSFTLPANTNVVLFAATLPTYETPQTITFAAPAAQAVGASLSLNATSTSGLAVYYTSSTASVCTVSGSTATMVAAGTCAITASQAGNSTFAAAASVSQSFSVGGPATTPLNLSSVYNVWAIANSGSAPANGGFDGASYAYAAALLGSSVTVQGVPYQLGGAGVADALSSVTVPLPAGSYASLNFVGAGAFGNQPSNNFVVTYTDGTTSTVMQGMSDWASPQMYAGETIASTMSYRIAPDGTVSNQPFYLFAYSLPLSSSKTVKSVTLPNSRNVVVLAMTLLGSNSITFPSIPATQTVGVPFTLSATASSGLTVSFASSTTSVCTVSNVTASFISAGKCTITASQAGNATYAAAAPVSQSVAVVAPQTITFGTIAPQAAGTTLALSATSTSGLPISYASSTASVCTISGSTATTVATGTCTLTAAQAGNSSYAAATSVSQSFAVLQSQSISFGGIGSQTSGVTLSLNATSSSGLAIGFASSTGSVCTVSGGTATLLAAGTCTITAMQPGNGTYAAAAPVAQSFFVGAAAPTPVSLSPVANIWAIANTGSAPLNGGFDGSSYAFPGALLGTSITAQGVAYQLGAAGVADAASSVTVPLPAGSYTSLNFMASANYGNQPTSTFVVTYTDGTTSTFVQGISDWGSPQKYAGETIASSPAYRITPSGSTQNGPWYVYAYALTLNSAKTVKSLTLPNSRNVVVLAVTLLGPNSITFPGIATQMVGVPLTLGATANSGLAVTYTSSTTSVCTVSGSTATMAAPGTCTITASQPGNGTYAAAIPVSQSFAVMASQAITFGAIPTQAAGGTLSLSATASSGLPVSYASSTTPVCTVSGSTATLVAAGTCTITASQAGNSSYTAATPVAQSFTVATQVNLTSVANIWAIGTNGTAPTNAGFDGSSYAFSGTLLGSPVTALGVPFQLGKPSVADAISNVTVALPAGSYKLLNFLASGAFGNQPSNTFVVTYTDGTTSSVTQGISDWGNPQKYAGETIAATQAYRITPSGTTQNGPWYVYAYTIPLNTTKTIKSITLPNSRNVLLFAITLD